MTEAKTTEFERAVDDALGRALRAPKIPHDFSTRLGAALSRAGETDLAELRARFDKERREQIQTLKADYIRVRRSTLGTLLGIAFAAGAAAVIAMPWLRAHLGAYTPMAIAWGGAALGLGVAFFEPLRRTLRRWSDAL